MIYWLVPIIITFVMAGPMWTEYVAVPDQDHFNVAATATFHSLLASAATSFVLFVVAK